MASWTTWRVSSAGRSMPAATVALASTIFAQPLTALTGKGLAWQMNDPETGTSVVQYRPGGVVGSVEAGRHLNAGDWETDHAQNPRCHTTAGPRATSFNHVVMPVIRTMQSRFARRVLLIALSTWIATWGCLGILLYFQDPPPPYVLDREDD